VIKVLHVPFSFYPDAAGGTEVYVNALAAALTKSDFAVAIAAPAKAAATYKYNGLQVYRYPLTEGPLALENLYGDGDPAACEGFQAILQRFEPDLVHFHALTSGVSLGLIRAAKARNCSVVFTYHTPTVSCVRGTLLRWGAEICDGRLDTKRCAQCQLQGLGLNRLASKFCGSIAPAIGRGVQWLGLSGGPWTALRMTELVERQHRTLRSVMTEVDRIVCVCEWARTLLIDNGFDATKIFLSRQGLAQDPIERPRKLTSGAVPRLVFLGRFSPEKGIHFLVEALLSAPELRLELDIFAVAQDATASTGLEALTKRIGADRRIRFRAPRPAEQVVELIGEYDAIVVPSQWLETGPLVVYEAFAAGVPVIGSDLGGIAELVEHGKTGLLIKPDSRTEWVSALRRVADDPALLTRLRAGIGFPRTMTTVAREMADLYLQLCRSSVLTSR
jgi:glycosyltransferase involved in cell wall biosynthesis